MTITQAMAEINKRYVPGTVNFFGAQLPDRWQDAHEEWHQAILRNLSNPEILPKVHELYCEKLSGLCDEFRRRGEPQRKYNPIEAFNNPQIHKYWESVHYKICYRCETKQGLKIKVIPNTTTSYLVCGGCEVRK